MNNQEQEARVRGQRYYSFDPVHGVVCNTHYCHDFRNCPVCRKRKIDKERKALIALLQEKPDIRMTVHTFNNEDEALKCTRQYREKNIGVFAGKDVIKNYDITLITKSKFGKRATSHGVPKLRHVNSSLRLLR